MALFGLANESLKVRVSRPTNRSWDEGGVALDGARLRAKIRASPSSSLLRSLDCEFIGDIELALYVVDVVVEEDELLQHALKQRGFFLWWELPED